MATDLQLTRDRLATQVSTSFIYPSLPSYAIHTIRQLFDASESASNSLNQIYQQALLKAQQVVVKMDANGDPISVHAVGATPGRRQFGLFNQFATVNMRAKDLQQRDIQQLTQDNDNRNPNKPK